MTQPTKARKKKDENGLRKHLEKVNFLYKIAISLRSKIYIHLQI